MGGDYVAGVSVDLLRGVFTFFGQVHKERRNHVELKNLISQNRVLLLVALQFTQGTLSACLWDSDTLKMQRRAEEQWRELREQSQAMKKRLAMDQTQYPQIRELIAGKFAAFG